MNGKRLFKGFLVMSIRFTKNNLMGIFGLMVTLALPVQAISTLELDERLQRLEKMAENPIYLKLMRHLEDQEKELQNLQDRMDHLAYELNKLKKQSNKRYAETDERMSQLEAQLKTLSQQVQQLKSQSLNTSVLQAEPHVTTKPELLAKKPIHLKSNELELNKPSSNESKPQIIKTHFPTPEEKAAYQAAFTLVKEAKYDEAIQAFQDFQQKYPTSKLAANSAYWLGEVSLLQKKNQQALDAFDQVLTKYPNSLKVPDAMLRKADVWVLLDEYDKAKTLYQAILKQYPKSRIAKKVHKRLQVLEDEKNAPNPSELKAQQGEKRE